MQTSLICRFRAIANKVIDNTINTPLNITAFAFLSFDFIAIELDQLVRATTISALALQEFMFCISDCINFPNHKRMKVIEFFSGIGGMRVSLSLAGIVVDDVTAYDTSPLCNTTYRHNFPDCDVRSKLVEQLSTADVEGVDLWTMSPPW
jgi:hypothetical protein